MGLDWVIVYDDLSTFSNLNGPPEHAPRGEVMCVAQRDPDCGYIIEQGTSYYVWLGEEYSWWGEKDERDWVMFNLSSKERVIVLFGYPTPYRRYKAALEKCREFEGPEGFQQKTAWRKSERRAW